MEKLAVIGPGLLGGSIALAARRAGGFHVAAWARRPEAVEQIRALGAVDFASPDIRAVVADASIAVLCVPIEAMPALARQLVGSMPDTALVTDVGSVKGPVVRELAPIFEKRGRFIGSHPMAGSEQSGMNAARANLFDGAVCIVTPEEGAPREDFEDAARFWRTLGCVVRRLSPEEHDEVVALVSHFPHLLAAALVELVAERNEAAFGFAGPGFRDTTRVASGPPEMWTGILRANRDQVKKTVEAMVEKLGEVLTLLDHLTEEGDSQMNEFLTQAKARRDTPRRD